jgi:hypothetical protein
MIQERSAPLPEGDELRLEEPDYGETDKETDEVFHVFAGWVAVEET